MEEVHGGEGQEGQEQRTTEAEKGKGRRNQDLARGPVRLVISSKLVGMKQLVLGLPSTNHPLPSAL